MSYICHCGNPSTDHEFVHQYVQTALVKIEDDTLVLNALDFPEQLKRVCAAPNCQMNEKAHISYNTILNKKRLMEETGSDTVHTFHPKEIKYRQINYVVQPDYVCFKCGYKFKDHIEFSNEIDHMFAIKIKVENKQKDDVVNIEEQEQDDTPINVVIVQAEKK